MKLLTCSLCFTCEFFFPQVLFVVCNIVNMTSEKAKDFCVRFTGKNYPAWESLGRRL